MQWWNIKSQLPFFNMRWIQAFIACKEVLLSHHWNSLSIFFDKHLTDEKYSFARPELCLIDLEWRQKRLFPSLCYLEWHRQTHTDILLFSLSSLLTVWLCLLYTHMLFSSLSHPHTSITHTYRSIQSRTRTLSLPFLQAVEMLLWL